MALWGIFISSFIIGFSGAMMPGPMLGITIEGSFKKGWIAGPLIVFGHGILEFILIIVLTFGLRDFLSNPIVAGVIGLFGGSYLAWMGYGMIKSSINKSISLENKEMREIDSNPKSIDTGTKNLIIAGALVSVTNPYFTLWWASTGIEFVRQSFTLGFIGVLFFYLGHISSDFVWFTAISTAFSKGKKFINDIIYRRIILFLGVFIIAFSLYFISSGWKMLVGPFLMALNTIS